MTRKKREFRTAKEAESMLRSLNKAAGYCRGPNSSKSMNERIQEVEQALEELQQEENNK